MMNPQGRNLGRNRVTLAQVLEWGQRYANCDQLFCPLNVRFVPAADILDRLFDHLVGAREHRRGYVEADRLRSLEVDYQLVLSRCLHRLVRRLGASKHTDGLDADLAIGVGWLLPYS